MSSAQSLFGTSGIRGDAEMLFTSQFSFDIGRSFAIFLAKHKQSGGVAIGMDPRGSSPRISKAVESGLLYEKREVYDQGATPVPSMNNILLTDPECVGSIMISGSHIQANLNGIKFFFNKEEILKIHEVEIEKIYTKIKNQVSFSEKLIDLHFENDAKVDYQEKLLKLARLPYPKWKIVADPGDGAQSDVMPFVLKTLGFDVIEMNATIQGHFFARDTEVPSDFSELCAKVKSEGAFLGVGYDSDGDRVIFIDENGNFVPGDFSCALIAKDLPGESVVTPINTSQTIDHVGKVVHRTKVGSPYVVAEMKKTGSVFGFEGNGGGIFNEMHSRDGGRMTIEILNLLSRDGKTLSQAISELPRYYISKDKVQYEWKLRDKILTEAKKTFSGVKTDELDGLKIWMDNSTWILFRSSMNAPEFRVFAESSEEVKSKQLLEKGIEFVKKWI